MPVRTAYRRKPKKYAPTGRRTNRFTTIRGAPTFIGPRQQRTSVSYRNKYNGAMLRMLYPVTRVVQLGTAGGSLAVTARSDNTPGLSINGVASILGNVALVFSLDGLSLSANGTAGALTQSMPGVAEFTALFDQYRIDYVEVRVNFSANSQSTNSLNHGMPEFFFAKDYDDASATTLNDIQQYDNVETWQPTGSSTSYMVKLKPRAANLFYNGVTSGYAPSNANQFFDTASSAIPFYGLKCAWQVLAPAGGTERHMGYLNFTVKYHMTFKGLK